MKQLMGLILVLSLTQGAFAEVLPGSRDWSAQKDVMTVMEKDGCFAETSSEIDINGTKEIWTLQVVALKNEEGDYSFPMIISFPEMDPTNEYYEATGKSNKQSSKTFQLTLLQPASGDKSIVANRVSDRNLIVNDLKAFSTFNVSYLSKEGATREVPFSLRGSSKTIANMLQACR